MKLKKKNLLKIKKYIYIPLIDLKLKRKSIKLRWKFKKLNKVKIKLCWRDKKKGFYPIKGWRQGFDKTPATATTKPKLHTNLSQRLTMVSKILNVYKLKLT